MSEPAAATYLPAPHAMQSAPPLLEPIVVPYLPASQLSHRLCPPADWCFPAGHALHAAAVVEPSPAAYRPAEHSMHADAPLLG